MKFSVSPRSFLLSPVSSYALILSILISTVIIYRDNENIPKCHRVRPNGYFTSHQVCRYKILLSAYGAHLCAFYGCQNKQRSFPCAALSGFYSGSGVCLLCAGNRIIDYSSDISLSGRTMGLAIIHRPFTAEARVQSQVSPCEIWGGHEVALSGYVGLPLWVLFHQCYLLIFIYS